MLSVRLPVYSKLLVVKFLESKVICRCFTAWEFAPQPPYYSRVSCIRLQDKSSYPYFTYGKLNSESQNDLPRSNQVQFIISGCEVYSFPWKLLFPLNLFRTQGIHTSPRKLRSGNYSKIKNIQPLKKLSKIKVDLR